MTGAILAGHDGRRGYIYHTAVNPAYRHQGIGTALVNAALHALANEGIIKSPSSSSHATMQATPSGNASVSLRAAIWPTATKPCAPSPASTREVRSGLPIRA
nr:GNAT family N-acetyltransferase [Bifidobacterium pseudolongum]